MSLLQQIRMFKKRICTVELMKCQEEIEDEVARRQTSKYNTKGEMNDR